jgi:ABC-type dipeptide/oligopeptide/nickel transport system ATPase subunit
MKTTLLQLKNVGPFDIFGFKPNPGLTVIRGPNGTGKTTLCNAVAYLVDKSHDPSLIKGYPDLKATSKAEIRLVIADPGGEYDGANFVATITADKTTRVLHHPKLGKIPVAKSKQWIEEVINVISLDPARFLMASDKEQVQIFLNAQPLRVTADQLGFVPVQYLKDVNLEQHALEVLGNKDGGIYGTIYEERSGINKEADVKEKYAIKLRETLPENPPDGNWSELYQAKSAELSGLRTDTQARVSGIKSDASKAIDAEDAVCAEFERQLDAELAAAIKKLEMDTEIARKAAQAERDAKFAEISQNRDAALDAAKAEYEPKNQALVAEISQAKTMIDQHAKAKATRDLIEQNEKEVEEAKAKSENLTAILKQIEAVKTDLLKETTIPGLELTDGILTLDGVPLRRVNDAKKHWKVCLQIGKSMAGQLGLVVMDNVEKFDENTLPLVEEAAKETGVQVIMMLASARDENGKKIDNLKISEVA